MFRKSVVLPRLVLFTSLACGGCGDVADVGGPRRDSGGSHSDAGRKTSVSHALDATLRDAGPGPALEDATFDGFSLDGRYDVAFLLGPCAADQSCPAGSGCFFPIGNCSSAGECIKEAYGPDSGAIESVCGCDGGPVQVAGPSGYTFGGPSPGPAVCESATGPVTCPLGSVTFLMTGTGLPYQSSNGNPGDDVRWYSLAKADGTPISIFFNPNTLATCQECEVLPPNAIGQGCNPIPASGVTAIWPGIVIGATSSCTPSADAGIGVSAPCQSVTCVPSGQYVVRMCTGCQGGTDGGLRCISVPFGYPTSGEVVGNAADASFLDAGSPRDGG